MTQPPPPFFTQPRTPLSDVEVSESISSFVTQGGDVYVCGSDTTRQLGMPLLIHIALPPHLYATP